ncbi:TonB family protein [Sphingomonas sp. KR3-1]|uniref:energy transducer TonB family protein n=1 Tax=Sphingomonas sp. KR3-1 TaxID=3156611 RepID=UPI0032B429F4
MRTDLGASTRRWPMDRSVVAGILVSLAVHALLLLLVFGLRSGTPAATRPVERGGAGQSIDVALLGADAFERPAAATSLDKAEAESKAKDAGARQAGAESPDATVAAPTALAAAGPSSIATGSSTPAAPSLAIAAPAGAAQPLPDGAVSGTDYFQRLQKHVAGYRRTLVATGQPQGVVLVRFYVSRSGEISALRVSTSSGTELLDDEALAWILRARPMPAIPAGLPDRISFVLPLSFDRTPG